MASRLKNHLEELKVLQKAKPNLRKNILKAADNSLIQCLCECSHNILNGNIKLTSGQKKTLKKHRSNIRLLARREGGVRKKRDLLVQSGGFLPALLVPVLSVAASIISSLVAR
jgi:hypothetical protein